MEIVDPQPAIIVSPALSSHALDPISAIATKLDLQLNLTGTNPQQEDIKEEEQGEEEEEEDDDYDFSFVCAEEACSPISADDLFDNGQIKTIFPYVSEDEVKLMSIPVTKVFLEAEDIAAGPYCAWSKTTDSARESTSSAPEACRKSNSTGFSKLRRFRHLLHRSHSDGKDTFVFLTKADKEETTSSSSKKTTNVISRKGKKEGKADSKAKSKSKSKTTPSMSSYALHYGEKNKEKRKSYLPYRRDLVGFFTNANAMTKNIHPY